ncbi:MAG: HD-GYP domain-containing protein [Vicinamibacterales bacterium]|nr:HD-GYP domain-containing protein [Vicinamibacterales bacterium]
MDPGTRLRLADDFVRRFAAALRGTQLYAPGHPLVERSLGALAESAGRFLDDEPAFAMGLLGQDIIVGDAPLPRGADNYGELVRRLQGLGIERIAFQRGVTPEEIATLVATLAHPERRAKAAAPGAEPSDALAVLGALAHIRVGRLQVDERVESSSSDVATIRRLYSDAVSMAGTLWETAQQEGIPNPKEAQTLVDSLAQAVAQNRTALVALTALKEYDNYTFTHMVNVSILTMAQARSVGIDGTLLREFGLAALMHDIGKVRTPTEILNKPDKLTDAEFAIMRMHPVDGAEILRQTPEMPTLAPIVAFEHHLRSDGTGYPFGLARPSLNIATMLCSIADVYDAMRSQRAYQHAFPTDRILAVLQRNDGVQFDQHLVRRFTQVMGIYPAGNLVRLNTGELAVVITVYAPDPHRPRVRVLMDARGASLPRPVDVDLWDAAPEGPGPSSVRGPVDPGEYGIDPLTYL